MILSDGRRIVPHNDKRASSPSPNIIPIHPDFRMIIMANRPGFPFLGNDFFGALGMFLYHIHIYFEIFACHSCVFEFFGCGIFLGDLFSCHDIDNPSPESELALLKSYGPDVPDALVQKLVRAFGELRSLADQGLVTYPYSTREVVHIVRHLQVCMQVVKFVFKRKHFENLSRSDSSSYFEGFTFYFPDRESTVTEQKIDFEILTDLYVLRSQESEKVDFKKCPSVCLSSVEVIVRTLLSRSI